MKIKRFTASNMQAGMKSISEALGPEAVILSNRRLDKGLEIVAGVDELEFERYEETLAKIPAPQTASKANSSDIIKANGNANSPSLDVATMQQLFGAMSEKNQSAFAEHKPGHVSQNQMSKSPLVRKQTNKNSEPLQRTFAADTEKVLTEKYEDRSTKPVKNPNSEVMQMLKQEIDGLKDLLKEQTIQLTEPEMIKQSPQLERIEARLTALGFSNSMTKKLLMHHDREDSLDHNWRKIMGRLSSALPVPLYDPLVNGGVYALTGPTGAGKTTTIAKLAAHGVRDFGAENVAVISLDWYQVCGQEILRSVTGILNVDFYPLNESDSLIEKLQQLSNKKLILIDTSGAIEATEHFSKLMMDRPLKTMVQTLLVLPANMHPAAVSQFIRLQVMTPLASVILSKLDESTCFGSSLEPILKNRWPIWYCTTGQEIPSDIELCDPKKLVKRLVKGLKTETSPFAVAS